LLFVFRRWLGRPATTAAIALLMLAATLADVLMPVFAGWLVDAVAAGTTPQSLRAALVALAGMAGLGVGMLATRHFAFLGIIRLTLHVMIGVAQDTFWRVQRFSSEWHANSFAGSTVRKISRVMWAIDMLDDTLLLALL